MSLSPGVQVQRSKVKGWGSPELAPCSVAVSSRCRLSNRDLEVLVRGPELVPSLVPSGNFRRQTYSWLWKALLPCTPIPLSVLISFSNILMVYRPKEVHNYILLNSFKNFYQHNILKTLLGVKKDFREHYLDAKQAIVDFHLKAILGENSSMSFFHVTKFQADLNQSLLVYLELAQHSDNLVPPNVLTQ